ncbi:hypothetical protein PoB_000871700 [Plakobranchus ocellatus]|uniref:Uncharacterized protein n=1 Tax=Plakobranchus ocellatus TaxID=259542 RepID=A0AAV3YIL7_9GAST|nr:hypothetical protein PoB_000871700 [Plakobranchus ocellatus]
MCPELSKRNYINNYCWDAKKFSRCNDDRLRGRSGIEYRDLLPPGSHLIKPNLLDMALFQSFGSPLSLRRVPGISSPMKLPRTSNIDLSVCVSSRQVGTTHPPGSIIDVIE